MADPVYNPDYVPQGANNRINDYSKKINHRALPRTASDREKFLLADFAVNLTGLTNGGAQVGTTITAVILWGDSTPGTGVTYQWHTDGTPIVGQTAATYDVVIAEDGKILTCVVSTNEYDDVTSNSAPIQMPAAVNNTPPSIAPTSPNIGDLLTVTAGSWTGGVLNTTTLYEWHVNGIVETSGETETTFDTTGYDFGDEIYCIERKINTGGNVPANSNTATIVEALTGVQFRQSTAVGAGAIPTTETDGVYGEFTVAGGMMSGNTTPLTVGDTTVGSTPITVVANGYTAANDTEVLAAMTAAGTGGTTIALREGSYSMDIASTDTPNAQFTSEVVITRSGEASKTNVKYTFMRLINASFVSFTDLTFDYTYAGGNNNENHFNLLGVDNVTITFCIFDGDEGGPATAPYDGFPVGNALWISSTDYMFDTTPGSNVSITDNTFRTFRRGIVADYQDDLVLSRNDLQDLSQEGFFMTGLHGCIQEDNYFANYRRPESGAHVDTLQWHQNTSDGVRGANNDIVIRRYVTDQIGDELYRQSLFARSFYQEDNPGDITRNWSNWLIEDCAITVNHKNGCAFVAVIDGLTIRRNSLLVNLDAASFSAAPDINVDEECTGVIIGQNVSAKIAKTAAGWDIYNNVDVDYTTGYAGMLVDNTIPGGEPNYVRVDGSLIDTNNSGAANIWPAGAVPDAFTLPDWLLEATEITTVNLPNNNDAALREFEYELDASGTWDSFSDGIADDRSYTIPDVGSSDVRIRALNLQGAGPASDIKQAASGAFSAFAVDNQGTTYGTFASFARAASKVGTFNAWWLQNLGAWAGNAAIVRLDATADGYLVFESLTGGRMKIELRDATNALMLQAISPTSMFAIGTWYNTMISWDVAAAKFHWYNANTDTGIVAGTSVDAELPAMTQVGAFANTAGSRLWTGYQSECFIDSVYRDLSVEGNRRAFVDAAGKPVDLNGLGSPELLLNNKTAGSWLTNKGSGNGLTPTGGTLVQAPSSPSD